MNNSDLRDDLYELGLLQLQGIASRLSKAVKGVVGLHQLRTLDVEGYILKWCVECHQNWPCATITAMEYNHD